jgi:hypothetical protein
MSLRETLQEMQRAEQGSAQETQELLREWRQSAIPNLYKRVEELLADLIQDHLVEIERHTEPRREELTGPYEIEVLDLKVGGKTLSLRPAARFVVGAKGRVDLVTRGRLDPVYFLLRDRGTEGQDQWAIVPSDARRKHPLSELPQLSRTTLEEAIQKLLAP